MGGRLSILPGGIRENVSKDSDKKLPYVFHDTILLAENRRQGEGEC